MATARHVHAVSAAVCVLVLLALPQLDAAGVCSAALTSSSTGDECVIVMEAVSDADCTQFSGQIHGGTISTSGGTPFCVWPLPGACSNLWVPGRCDSVSSQNVADTLSKALSPAQLQQYLTANGKAVQAAGDKGIKLPGSGVVVGTGFRPNNNIPASNPGGCNLAQTTTAALNNNPVCGRKLKR